MLLQSTPDGTKAFKLAGDTSDGDVAKLERFLDVTRSELLFAKGIIFVEGDAERHLIPAFASRLNIRLDEYGISVVSINHAHFEPFVQLVRENSFNIPFVVLTDGDPEKAVTGLKRCQKIYKQIEGKEAASSEELEQAGFFIGEYTLELDLVKTCAQLMSRVYKNIEANQDKQAKFDKSINLIQSGGQQSAGLVEAQTTLLNAIKEQSKGYFAQLLALEIEQPESADVCPPHIRRCIEKIVELVSNRSNNNAI